MLSKGLMARLTVAALSTTLAAAPEPTPHSSEAPTEEPFRSFRLLDAKLTVLTHQQDALKTASSPQAGSESIKTPSWRRRTACRSMNFTAAGIGQIAGGLEHLYDVRHRRFGVQIFGNIRAKAQDVQLAVNNVARAQTRSALDLATKRLDERIVSLVVQFQAASGGYGATRCPPSAWTCCEPKRSKDILQSEVLACIWGCARTSQTCTGFLGPRIAEP